jgi:hypothetical protein
MKRGVEKMAGRGYVLNSQSGDFSGDLFGLQWHRRKVVVMYEFVRAPTRG